MADLLIVGAGPVGLTMAAELARYDVSIRIIDRALTATQTSKALVLWSRTLELMDRMGCTQTFLDAGLRAHSASLRTAASLLAHVSLDDVASPYNFALMIPQRDTERLMAEHLATFGVAVERTVELTTFSDKTDHVEANLRHADGREETVETPWLIGCDGAHSTVRHGMGVEFSGEAQDDDWLLADVRLEGDGAPPADQIAIYFHQDGVFVVFPIPGGRTRIVSTIGKTDPAHPRPDPTLADVQKQADERTGGGFTVVDPVWLSNFRINERKCADYSQGRVFLAGDAAHVHSPAGGQGMNTGMHDAINLAWKMAMVNAGSGAPSLLDSYSLERSAVGTMVLRNATRLTDLATLSQPAAEGIRNATIRFLFGFNAVRGLMSTALSEVDIAYPRSPLSVGHQAGARLAPDQFAGPPPGAGKRPLFVLFAEDKIKGSALIARFPNLLESEVRTPHQPARLLLVRPDGYVGLSTSASDWNQADDYLAKLAVSTDSKS